MKNKICEKYFNNQTFINTTFNSKGYEEYDKAYECEKFLDDSPQKHANEQYPITLDNKEEYSRTIGDVLRNTKKQRTKTSNPPSMLPPKLLDRGHVGQVE